MDSSQPPKRQKQFHREEAFPATITQPFLMPSSLFEYRSGSKRHLRDSGDARGTLSLSLSSDRRCYESNAVGLGDDELVWRSSVPLGPFTGYASILNRSRFLKPAQDLLDELCGVDSRLFGRNYHVQGFRDDDCMDDDAYSARKTCKDPSLTLVLDEVLKRCKQYYQHLQSVVASFEAVCGLENAAPYISFAFRTMAQQFSCLKKTIFERTQIAGETIGSSSISSATLGCQDPHTRCEIRKPVQISTAIQHPVWRSERGLPACAVAVFKNWLFEHFLHPYPSDAEKNLLAQQTGLSRNQVSNWFINARVRLWKPLVEEIHTHDEQQGQPALKTDLKASRATVLNQPPSMHSVNHQAGFIPLQMSLGKQRQDRFNTSSSEWSTDFHSTFATKHAKPDENMDISLALALQQKDVSGNQTARNVENIQKMLN